MLEFIKKKKFIIGSAIAIVVIVVTGLKISGNGTIETVSPVTGDLVRTVKISGKVIPKESVDLGFETSGTVANNYKDVGQSVRSGETITRLDTSTLSTDIAKAEADLAIARAGLSKLEGSSSIEAEVSVTRQALIQTIKNAYAASEDAVYNKTDQIFIDPESTNPRMAPSLNDSDLRDSINSNRATIGNTLLKWRTLITNLNTDTYSDNILTQSKQYLSVISNYISDISRATGLFKADNAFSQETLNEYKTDTTTARSNLNTATQNLIADENSLKGLLQDVPAQVARVESAAATLANYRSQLYKASIVSPINGVVSRQDAKVGQVVGAASSLVSVISEELEVEAYIPEVLIAGVMVGNTTTITLDAYPDMHFEGKVVRMDPAETIRDGVSTYKTRIAFTFPYPIIRSGMTSNIDIMTYRKPEVTLIPERTVIREDEEAFVYILENGENKKTKVSIGERDSQGNVELLSTLPEGSKLITNPPTN